MSDEKKAAAALPAAESAPKTKRGQKYVSPEGRHSQQTHPRAEARETSNGFTNAKEQHAADRNAVEAEITRVAEMKAKNKANSTRGAAPKP